MAKIIGSGNTGQMIHDNLEMAGKKGFKNIARIWYDKTQPISAGIDQIVNDARAREDILCPLKDMRFRQDGMGDVVMEYKDGREFTPTEHAWKQVATWMYVSHGFMRQYQNPVTNQNGTVKFERDNQDKEILMKVFENGYRRIDPDKVFRFRTYSDGTLRAMFSEMYTPIDNVWYLEEIQKLFKQIGGDEPRLSHWKGDADTVYGNILLPDTCRQEDDSDYGGMISLSNCEIGKRRFCQMPSLFRAICMNGCIYDQTHGSKYSMVHRGKTLDLERIRLKLVDNIHSQIPLLQSGVDKYLALRDRKVSAPLRNIFALIGVENRLSAKQVYDIGDQYATYESDNKSSFGIINAITRAGQNYSPAEWVGFDEIGGRMMEQSEKRWENFNNRAAHMDKETIDKAYGVVAV
jgi:hypothetical protein